ncbi:MAG: aminopeptidase P family protein [Candidatus Midichloria sp.]|nr:MAG: aminopeptidase P family protein [Candidatus Midichloria sp.]
MKSFDRITKVKNLLKQYNIDGYIVPSYDEFRNEYTPKPLQRLEWLTGFTGSSGLLIIKEEKLLFLTDSRYLLQAKQQLGNKYQILDIADEESWKKITKAVKNYCILGYDPMIESISSIQYYQKVFSHKNIQLQAVKENLIDLIWLDKPKLGSKKILRLTKKEAGLSTEEKLEQLLLKIDKNVDYLLVTQLDSICWLLNIRGSDIKYSPLILSYLLIKKKGNIYLFSDSVTEKIEGVKILKLKQIKELFIELIIPGSIVQSSKEVSHWFKETAGASMIIKEDIIELMKACKNNVELEHIRQAHFLDGLALCKFICWLEAHIGKVTEISAAEKLLKFRQMANNFIDLSFTTISAFAENGAIVHYKPTKKTNKTITKDNLYLLDSGGQYRFGTTDVTRTFCFGIPTIEQKRDYTLVLKGLIRLSQLKFPISTNGAQLDSLARLDLWQHGLDYGHSTGHGVGYFLSVHEGPQTLSRSGSVPLKTGMITSNEPGYYKEGEYGIRIENLMLVRESEVKGFLEFETLTLVPIPLNLIDFELLDNREKVWLQNYNLKIFEIMSPHLNVEEKNQLQSICYC